MNFRDWIDCWMQDCSISSSLAMEIPETCTKPSTCQAAKADTKESKSHLVHLVLSCHVTRPHGYLHKKCDCCWILFLPWNSSYNQVLLTRHNIKHNAHSTKMAKPEPRWGFEFIKDPTGRLLADNVYICEEFCARAWKMFFLHWWIFSPLADWRQHSWLIN